MMPHLPYVDSVAAELTLAAVPAEVVRAEETEHGDLVGLFEWPEDRVTLRWHSADGWRHEAPHCGGPLFIDHIAAPDVVANTVRLLLDGHPPYRSYARWTGAATLDRALADRGC
ncbi:MULTISPECIES: hypothetical protein [Streptomyces]|uniref:Uncharacterized protein n=1 Tax=Streptomyces dengpaensis TaxID=2049881 RepID=A0ABN5I5Q4_9ACTN|nr:MULTISPECIES: hypothetical protein [Streptomyces]AVH58411.1 hypothetical protein C4B68_24525 [Streptomyces dengpaensis]PIB06084.1 hypothetical protein B1C81_26245 [Streptomyces sp. HG99]